MPHAEFDVFLSHNSVDKPFVEELAKRLKEQKLRPFLDKWNLVPGAAWQPELEAAMKSCATAAIVFGSMGDGPWHNAEMQVLLNRAQRERGEFRLIPVLLEGADPAKVGSFMELRTWVDFGKDPFDVALKRLVAGIKGEPPEDGSGYNLPDEPAPYRSLQRFEARHADYFFGRNPDIEKLVQRLAQQTFVAVVGASGSGKSSLVRAGLATTLARKKLPTLAEWQTLTVIPGSRPLRELVRAFLKMMNVSETEMTDRLDKEITRYEQDDRAFVDQLLDRDGSWLVIIDQFEEIFTQGQANSGEAGSIRDQTEKFIAVLNRTVQLSGGRVRVILTLRADFLHCCLDFPAFKDLLQDKQFLLGQLEETGLREAIVRPANKVGALYEKGLVERILSDVLGQSGSLPLLQHALHELWQKRRGAWLTNAAYDETGGVEGALRKRADETYAGLTDRQKQIARNVFMRLTTLGEGVSDTRRRASRSELYLSGFEHAEIDDVLKSLSGDQARLIEASERTVEVTHEAVIQKWSMLRDWLDANRNALRTHRQLTEASNEWAKSHDEASKRDPSLLYMGSRLAAAREMSHRESVTLNDLEGQFLGASMQAARAKKVRTIMGWVGTVAAVVLLAAGGTIVAINKRNEAVAKNDVQITVESLASAEPAAVPKIAEKLDAHAELAATYLTPLVSLEAKTNDDKRRRLHARLAMVARDKSLIEPLLEELLTNKVAYIGPIRQQLRPYAGELTQKLLAILQDESADAGRRFHAAAALADYVPASDAASWTDKDLQFVAKQLVSANPENQPLLRYNLQPISGRLLADLERIFSDPKSTEAQRLSAANALADYGVSDIPMLTQLLAVATPEQYAVLYPVVAASPATSTVEDLSLIAATLPSTELGSVERVGYGQRRANAAVTLLRLGEREKVLRVFDMTDDPEALTQFIFRCRERGIGPQALLECLQQVSDAQPNRHPKNSRYALLLALGEFSLSEIPAPRREVLLTQLSDWYLNDPSSSVHGAAGWLLRQWGQTDSARKVDQTEIPFAPDREWFTLAVTVTPTAPLKPPKKPVEDKAAAERAAGTDESGKPAPPRDGTIPEPSPEPQPPKTFYYTFIVFPAGDYDIGSVSEPDRIKDEVRHPVKLTLRFALLDREITLEELIAFSPDYLGYMQQFDATPADAGFAADWYDSVAFCRWLSQMWGLSEADQSYADPKDLDKERYPHEPNPVANWAPRNWPLELGRRGFRLPTESEWEVASRAGTRTAYGFGSDTALLRRFGWFNENSLKHVHFGRELRPSVRGLFDTHGNLYEWTHDWFGNYGVGEITDPLGANGGWYRVSRGGAWSDVAANCRAAIRVTNATTSRTNDLGFRLALSLPGAAPKAGVNKRAEPSGGGTEEAHAGQRPEMP